MSLGLWIGVGAVGGVGALARFAVDGFVSGRSKTGLPFGTLAVNVSGAALLGLFVGLAVRGDAFLLVGSGLIGAYTTFSTWMLETHRLAEDGELLAATLNVVLSVAAGLGAAEAGRTM